MEDCSNTQAIQAKMDALRKKRLTLDAEIAQLEEIVSDPMKVMQYQIDQLQEEVKELRKKKAAPPKDSAYELESPQPWEVIPPYRRPDRIRPLRPYPDIRFMSERPHRSLISR